MNTFMRLRATCAATLTVVSLAAASHAASNELDAATVARIDAVAGAAIRERQTVGLAVGVMSGGRMILAKGYGSADLEHDVAVTADTVFRIGSITKQCTAAAVLRLVEQGTLRLDDKLAKYYADFPRAGDVTIEQLLNHTSGIHSYTNNPDYERYSRQDYTTNELVALIAKQQPAYDFEPGTAWSYSNSGYFLLGAIIEKISGASLAGFFEKELFARVGIEHTAVDSNSEIVAHRAAGYERPGPDSREIYNASFVSMTVPGAAGDLRSTIGDLARWSHELFGGKVLTPESLSKMIAPGRLSSGERASTKLFVPPPPPGVTVDAAAPPPFRGDFGFGLLIDENDGHSRVWHGGGINGFSSTLETYPDLDLTIVVLANTAGGADPAAAGIGTAVLRQFEKPQASRRPD